MARSAFAACKSLSSISSIGVSKSLKLITAKSCPRGAPSRAPPLNAAVTPGITSTIGESDSPTSSRIRPLIPYTPASPLQISATVMPASAFSIAIRHRSVSCLMGVVIHSFPGKCSRIKSAYTV